jgi:hypothetical protein
VDHRVQVGAVIAGLDRLPQRVLVLERDEEAQIAIGRQDVTGPDIGQLGERERGDVRERPGSGTPSRGSSAGAS